MLNRFQWTGVLALLSALILPCFAASVAGGVAWAIWLLPLSGLFMSVIYPTINSKGISCLPLSEHGAGAGVILFFTSFRPYSRLLQWERSAIKWAARAMVSFWQQDLPPCCSSGSRAEPDFQSDGSRVSAARRNRVQF
jgi:hypothetical protein